LPVGSAGVPPQVQVVAACADAAPHPPAASDVAAIAVTVTIARSLIFLSPFARAARWRVVVTLVPGGPGSASADRIRRAWLTQEGD